MEEWIEEFLFRGRPPSGPGADEAPAFHVVIGQQAQSPLDPAEKVRRTVGPMSAEQAETAGWPLSRLIEGVNAEALTHVAQLDARIAELEAAMVTASSEILRLEALVSQQQKNVI